MAIPKTKIKKQRIEKLSAQAAARYKNMIKEHERDKDKGLVKSFTFEEALEVLR